MFNKSFHEDAISDYLAYILNPKVNGIGIEPLKNLIMAANGKWQDAFGEIVDEISITREYAFNNGRRIDLLIQIGDQMIVGIEHKVFSQEHNNQTRDYKQKIEAQFPDHEHTFIFLSPDKRQALAHQAFRAIGYEDLVNLLKQVNFDYLKNIKKTMLYQDFITHLEANFMKDETYTISEKTSLYLEHFRMIQDLRNNFEHDYKRVHDFIMNFLKNNIENNTKMEWIINANPDRGYQQISKTSWKTKGLDIHFEIKLSKEKFASHSPIEFMIDIEGAKKQLFTEHLLQMYPSDITQFVEQNNLNRSERSRTFVAKEYELFQIDHLDDQDVLKGKLEHMIKDFTGFVKVIDDALLRFS
ncbi:PD-(D/E)XK nuclease family protein [Gracilibacillus oryzae]|uniref:PD-(D/E)XK nuclease family protein n=1 Tax=Gracilibacillus oryzae TaxID=1672701 RepID=UPI001D185A07|nr:PD-(D/E)XK nuclease family protein [Gracilibacillus oryzae]